MKKATAQDAEIFLKLMDTLDTPQMEQSMRWFVKEFSAKDYRDFKSKYPMGSEEYGHVGRVLSSFELAGALISHGLLNENLVLRRKRYRVHVEAAGEADPRMAEGGWRCTLGECGVVG